METHSDSIVPTLLARQRAEEPPTAAAAGKKKAAAATTKHKQQDKQESDPAAAEWKQPGTTGTGRKVMPMLVSDKYAETKLPDLAQLDPTTMKLDGTVVAIGKRRTGKSWAFRHILHALRDEFDAGICISQTDELNHYWRQYMPARYIFNRYDPAILQAVFERQKAIINDRSDGLTPEQQERKARFFIILDDVISDQKIRYSPEIAELFVAGRHYDL
jgi:hypothetical protein